MISSWTGTNTGASSFFGSGSAGTAGFTGSTEGSDFTVTAGSKRYPQAEQNLFFSGTSLPQEGHFFFGFCLTTVFLETGTAFDFSLSATGVTEDTADAVLTVLLLAAGCCCTDLSGTAGAFVTSAS